MSDQLFDLITKQRITPINGPAGSGKSTRISLIQKRAKEAGYKTIITATTGKAASNAKKKAQTSEVSTLHNAIFEYDSKSSVGDSNVFKQRSLMNNEKTIVIVDEAGLIGDSSPQQDFLRYGNNGLLTELHTAFGPNTHIATLGDECQLPPVFENTSVALDKDYLEKKFNTQVVGHTLTNNFRQQQCPNLTRFNSNLRKNIKENNTSAPLFSGPFFFPENDIEVVSLDEALEKYVSLFNQNKTQTTFIAYTNPEVHQLNTIIRNRLDFYGELNLKDHFLVTKNSLRDPALNGETFSINSLCDITTSIVRPNGGTPIQLRFQKASISIENNTFDTTLLLNSLHVKDKASITKEINQALNVEVKQRLGTTSYLAQKRSDPYLNSLCFKFAYAITAHKSQGSDYLHAFIKVPQLSQFGGNKLQYMKWIYTAMTRSSGKAYLVF